MIIENVLLFLITLFAILSVILIWKKFNTKGWPYPWPMNPQPTTEFMQKIKDRLHRKYEGMLDFGVSQYSQVFLTIWISIYLYLRYLSSDSIVTLRSSTLIAMFMTFMVYVFIYGMKTRDVDSIRWDTIRVGWPWYEDKHKPTWLVRNQKDEEENDQRRE